MKKLLLAACVAALLVSAFGSAACGDDDESSADAGVISSISILDNAGLHELDQSINSGTIPDTARTTALHLQTVVLETVWPSEAKDQATKLAAIFGDLAAKLDAASPDPKVVGPVAHDAHEGEHDFSHTVWDSLQKKAGVAASNEAPDTD